MSAPTGLYRHQTKTPGSYLIGLDFDLQNGGFYEALRAPKREKPFLYFLNKIIKIPFRVPLGLIRPYKANRALLGNLYWRAAAISPARRK